MLTSFESLLEGILVEGVLKVFQAEDALNWAYNNIMITMITSKRLTQLLFTMDSHL